MADEQAPSHLATYALRLGDDALVLSQRLAEWCADAPLLEEDIAISNVGLDYLGRARMLLQYAGKLLGQSEDELAFMRDSADFKNLLIAELPRGDFAFSMLRQYLIDEFESLYFPVLSQSADPTLAAVAVKTNKEVEYHLRRSSEWLRRLGLGTEESNRRTQVALEDLWGFVAEFFLMDELEVNLCENGIAVDRTLLEARWREQVVKMLESVNLRVPADNIRQRGGREGRHTEHLGHMLTEMQFLQRAYPGLEW